MNGRLTFEMWIDWERKWFFIGIEELEYNIPDRNLNGGERMGKDREEIAKRIRADKAVSNKRKQKGEC